MDNFIKRDGYPPVTPEMYGLDAQSGATPPPAGSGHGLSLGQRMFLRLGLVTPIQRGLVTGALMGVTLYTIRPSAMFSEYGEKTWVVFAGGDADKRDVTYAPWWLVSVLAGAGAAILL